MFVRRKAVALAAAAAGLLSVAAPSGHAAPPFLPVGSGAWGPSPAVAGTCGAGVWTGSTACTISASSLFTGPGGRPVETCRNATYVVTTPVIIGTNFGCHIDFSGTLQATGAGRTENATDDVEIEVGACAGLTLVGPTLTVTDGAAGTYVLHPKVTVSNAGWKIQGHLVSVDISSTAVVVLNAVGTIAPGCKKVKARTGETSVTFTGVFNGSYQFL